jgi:hypothetical protein
VYYDAAQQKIAADTSPPPRKPLPSTAGGGFLTDPSQLAAVDSSPTHQQIIQEAQKLVEDQSREHDGADGTEQIKNWFLS